MLRSEYKYLLDEAEALKIRSRIEKLLLPDPHAGSDGYIVRSLYFDTPDNEDFETKLAGVPERKKIRLRTYDPDEPWCILEEKRKSGNLGRKTGIRIQRADAALLIRGEFSALLNYADVSEEAVRLYTELMLGCMRPAALIEYRRHAYIYRDFNTRITFDSGICSTEADFDLFRRDPGLFPVLEGKTVLEVKFDRHLMGFIRDILKPSKLVRLSVSKYCFGRPLYYI